MKWMRGQTLLTWPKGEPSNFLSGPTRSLTYTHTHTPSIQCTVMAATLSSLVLKLPIQTTSKSKRQIRTNNNEKSSVVEHLKLASAFALPLVLESKDALAAGGEYGILEGRTLALVHPLAMGGLFAYTLWSGYLGWQWRRVRTIQDDINQLKKQQQPPEQPLDTQIQLLTQERKDLIKGGYRDKHFNAGSLLLAFGVSQSIFGGLNTWLRTGKLFPGPHLFAGAGITVLWAAAAALVPAMQKGNETARNLHIALNALNVLLFACQIPTGIEILLKVFEFTKWP